MKKKTLLHAALWLCVLGWAGLIFYFSAQNADTSSGQSGRVIRLILQTFYPAFDELPSEQTSSMIEALQTIVRKGAHFCLYGGLGFWLGNALFSYRRRFFPTTAAAWLAAVLYACTDEFHQSFVAGRSGEVRDILIDAGGALLGVLVTLFFWWLARRKENAKKSTAA